MEIVRTLRFLVSHPLNAHRKAAAVRDFVRWQVGSRLVTGPVAVPFVADTRLLVSRGMMGATGNLYTGLHEFEDMAFVLHLLRPGDLFVDVGANIGSYTVLASGGAGADTVAVEPLPETYRILMDNINLNGLHDRVRAHNLAVGAEEGRVRFTRNLDAMNHVAVQGESATLEVPVQTLDRLVAGRAPTCAKIDVEGFESPVLSGAEGVLASPELLAIVVELNGSGDRYGYDDEVVHRSLLDHGFSLCRYRPLARSLERVERREAGAGNGLYVRHTEAVEDRLRHAPRYRVHGSLL